MRVTMVSISPTVMYGDLIFSVHTIPDHSMPPLSITKNSMYLFAIEYFKIICHWDEQLMQKIYEDAFILWH